jgi:hypothetical protein
MSRHHGRYQRLSMLGAMVVVVTLTALLYDSPAGAAPGARSTTVRAADAKSWCAAVIATNTKLGTMKNKTFISTAKVSPTAWKNVVDAAVAGRSRFIALAPSSIKTAVAHEMAYFAHIKANHYAKTTPLAPWTIAEVNKITNFEKTQCGIKFS